MTEIYGEPNGPDEILQVAVCQRWHVTASNLLTVADLVREGLVRVEDDYDIIAVHATDTGVQAALDRGLVFERDGRLRRRIKGSET
jgi:hypothetical protein